jgi:hypothetical protein
MTAPNQTHAVDAVALLFVYFRQGLRDTDVHRWA